MKRYSLTLLTVYCFAAQLLANPADSLVINFANRTKLVIHAPDKKGIQALTAYDLNKIVREMGMKLDSVPNGRTYVIDEKNGQRYLKDTVLVVTRKGNNVNVIIESNRPDNIDTIGSSSITYQKVRKRVSDSGLKIKTDFQIGLNTFISQSALPAYPNGVYDLTPLGSRYFAINFYRNPTLIKGKSARLSVRYGLEVAWNNYMFEENIRANKGATAVEFAPVMESLKKSKLTVATVQLPVVPQVSFYNDNGKKTFHIGLGGLIGYRIDSYTKVKFENNDKRRDHSNFYLNDLQYGLVANIGLLKTDLFVKYNLNSVFRTNQGPDLRTISFGISL